MDLHAALPGLVQALDHIAVVVPSIAAARPIYEGLLGMPGGDPEFVADQKVNVLCVSAGGQRLELVEPAAPDSPVSGFLAKRGPGLHHLAYRVDDVAKAIALLEAAGVQMIDRAPRPGAHGTRIAFVHPKSTGGVLTELVELPRQAAH
jgi:methylmalonyl-CoA epimerase